MVTWGPDAWKLTQAERDAILADVHAQADRWHKEQMDAEAALRAAGRQGTHIAMPIDQISCIYAHLVTISRLSNRSLADDFHPLLSKIFGHADMGALHAGQWLPMELRTHVRAAAIAALQKPEEGPDDGAS